jgi:hypothetical protein
LIAGSKREKKRKEEKLTKGRPLNTTNFGGAMRRVGAFWVGKRLWPVALGLLLSLLCVHFFQRAALAFDVPDPSRFPPSPTETLWRFMPYGYIFSIAIETPVLLIGLSKQVSVKQRLFAGVWLTACSYPIVILVMPAFFGENSRGLYLLVAEIFAPVSECALFWLAFQGRMDLPTRTKVRNFAVIVLANLMSFGGGEIMHSVHWLGIF